MQGSNYLRTSFRIPPIRYCYTVLVDNFQRATKYAYTRMSVKIICLNQKAIRHANVIRVKPSNQFTFSLGNSQIQAARKTQAPVRMQILKPSIPGTY
jgi:hypothetical protein